MILMIILVSKFSRPGQLVLDTCACTFATAKACVPLPMYRRLVGCETDLECFLDVLPSLVEVYAKTLLSPESDIVGSEKVVAAGKIFVKDMAALASRKTVDSWIVPSSGLLAVQNFPDYMLYLIDNVYRETGLFEVFRQLPLSQWAEKWRGRFYGMDMNMLLALDALAQGLTVKKSTIPHTESGMWCLLPERLGKGK